MQRTCGVVTCVVGLMLGGVAAAGGEGGGGESEKEERGGFHGDGAPIALSKSARLAW